MIKAYIKSHRLRFVTCVGICLLILSDAICSRSLIADERDNSHQSVVTLPSDSKPVPLSESEVSDMLIYKVNPDYSISAKAARVSGIVMLKATISKAGDITNLHVICGPELLQDASIKAVQQWKYRPYILRGKPVEVDTTIRVIFALGNKKKLKFSKGSCPAE